MKRLQFVNIGEATLADNSFRNAFRSIKPFVLSGINKGVLTLQGLGGGGVFHQARDFVPITLEDIKVRSRNLVTFPIL